MKFFLQIYDNKKQFASPESKEAAIKAEKRLMLVPVTFVLVRIWGTLRFILYTFAGVHSLNTTYGIVFLYLQVSLLWYAASVTSFSTGVVANLTIFCLSIFANMSLTIKITRHSRELDSHVDYWHFREVLWVWPHFFNSRNIDEKPLYLSVSYFLLDINPSINS